MSDPIITALQEAMRQAMAEAANAEIEKAKHRFECEMGKVKREMIGAFIEQVYIRVKREVPGPYVIQIVLEGEGNE